MNRHPLENVPKLTESDWGHFLNHRAFLGILNQHECVQQGNELVEEGSFYIAIMIDGTIELVLQKSDFGIRHITVLDATWKSINNRIEVYGCTKPLDRGDALVYRELRDKLAKEAIKCWTAVGRRLGLVKDLRCLIGQLLWTWRGEWIH